LFSLASGTVPPCWFPLRETKIDSIRTNTFPQNSALCIRGHVLVLLLVLMTFHLFTVHCAKAYVPQDILKMYSVHVCARLQRDDAIPVVSCV
jgi:hypothetical protein